MDAHIEHNIKEMIVIGRHIIDITGQVFGYLTVIKRVEDKVYPSGSTEPQYLCKCICGNEIIKESRLLRRAKSNLSCGCIREPAKYDLTEDLTGQRFGKLLVLSRADQENNWNCLCDCGNKIIFSSNQLKRGCRKNCGCEPRRAKSAFKDLTGTKFGRLVVLYRDKNDKTGHTKWICKCDCGNVVSVYKDALLDGRQISCGCYKREVKQSKEYRNSIRLFNEYKFTEEYGIGLCSNTRKEFYFDLDDYDLIKKYTWREDANGYIVASIERSDNHPTMIFMHRLVMGLTQNDGLEVDHIGHNTYDNRKKYLRVCTHGENESNRVLMKNNTSGVTGVSWNDRDGTWDAYIGKNLERIDLGHYNNFSKAVVARKSAEEKYFGEHSFDNSMTFYNAENQIKSKDNE